MKFKPGDRVVVVGGYGYEDSYYPKKVGEVGTVANTKYNGEKYTYLESFQQYGCYRNTDLVLESVYNSKLYKLLNNDNQEKE